MTGLAGKIKVVAYDASPEEIEALEKGEIHGLVVQQPYLMGYRGVEYLLAAREG
ncbi:MAG: substrate-binding domain-containing protein, partial [Firmicutes bacterium]|nr:substrate-binding domain-containing protein [Bacillota bacterium]